MALLSTGGVSGGGAILSELFSLGWTGMDFEEGLLPDSGLVGAGRGSGLAAWAPGFGLEEGSCHKWDDEADEKII